MSAPTVLEFVTAALPRAPARVLEVGAGAGELARDLAAAGYDVVAIDPASEVAHVEPVALLDLAAPPASFDAAVAVVSLHHVEPLRPSCERLAGLVRPGGALVIDEFDVGVFDERAAGWLHAHWRKLGREAHEDHAGMVAELRQHLHRIDTIRAALAPAFELQGAEEEAIAQDVIPAVGVRFTGVRRAAGAR